VNTAASVSILQAGALELSCYRFSAPVPERERFFLILSKSVGE